MALDDTLTQPTQPQSFQHSTQANDLTQPTQPFQLGGGGPAFGVAAASTASAGSSVVALLVPSGRDQQSIHLDSAKQTEYLLGRHSTCDIVIDNELMSSKHCHISIASI
ncbi:hypothetical protein EV182_000386 [Spiromyces aspiralis]|uniref:Uncharacterized protein n=1 Tax=Spiromyces aspiralis TaxID=68401 RepID=A0ACC1HX54_9FUNG|nr:hypothetical protein EV182_000386 [Spiromyces aspiralis]